MKNTYIIISCIVLFPFTVLAENWTKEDTNREIVYSVLHVVDWQQTRTIAANPERYKELNPLLGKHPSIQEVDIYMASSLLAHIGIAYILPLKWREAFQYVTIGERGSTVYGNIRIGIR